MGSFVSCWPGGTFASSAVRISAFASSSANAVAPRVPVIVIVNAGTASPTLWSLITVITGGPSAMKLIWYALALNATPRASVTCAVNVVRTESKSDCRMTGFEVASAPPSMAAGLVTCRSLEYWLLWITVTVPGPVFQDAPVAVARTPTVAGLLRVTTAAACVAYPSDLEVVTSVPAATVNCAGQVDDEHVNTTEPEAKVAETKTVLAV